MSRTFNGLPIHISGFLAVDYIPIRYAFDSRSRVSPYWMFVPCEEHEAQAYVVSRAFAEAGMKSCVYPIEKGPSTDA